MQVKWLGFKLQDLSSHIIRSCCLSEVRLQLDFSSSRWIVLSSQDSDSVE